MIITFKDPKLVYSRLFHMNRQQCYSRLTKFLMLDIWMRGMLAHDISLSPLLGERSITISKLSWGRNRLQRRHTDLINIALPQHRELWAILPSRGTYGEVYKIC